MAMREVIYDVLANAIGAGIAIFVMGLLYLGTTSYGPQTDAWLFPIVRIELVPHSIYRDKDRACFMIHLTKLRPARVQKYVFQIEPELSNPINVAAYLTNPITGGRISSDLVTHAVGTQWDRRYCFEMPATIADWQNLRVTGHAEHKRFDWMWTVPTPVPEFIISAVTK